MVQQILKSLRRDACEKHLTRRTNQCWSASSRWHLKLFVSAHALNTVNGPTVILLQQCCSLIQLTRTSVVFWLHVSRTATCTNRWCHLQKTKSGQWMSLLAALKKATKHIYTILKMVNWLVFIYLKAQLVLISVFTTLSQNHPFTHKRTWAAESGGQTHMHSHKEARACGGQVLAHQWVNLTQALIPPQIQDDFYYQYWEKFG